MENKDLVFLDDHGLRGSNFYWHKAEAYGLSQEELTDVGVTDGRVKIHKNLVEPLKQVNRDFLQKLGYSLHVKEGYRSPGLYRLVYDKRVQTFGQEMTDRLLNIKDMPHATGLSVDVALWDDTSNREVFMRDGKDDPEALFIDFYKDKTDEKSVYYQNLQERVVDIMQTNGFRLGKRREYFHFNYQPDQPINYP